MYICKQYILYNIHGKFITYPWTVNCCVKSPPPLNIRPEYHFGSFRKRNAIAYHLLYS